MTNGSYQRNQTDLREMKNINSKMKNPTYGPNGRLDTTEDQ